VVALVLSAELVMAPKAINLLQPSNDQALFNSEFMGAVNIHNEIAKTARINPVAINCS
jgi:hypothetical protein